MRPRRLFTVPFARTPWKGLSSRQERPPRLKLVKSARGARLLSIRHTLCEWIGPRNASVLQRQRRVWQGHVTVVSVNETKTHGPARAGAHRTGDRPEASGSGQAVGDARSDEARGKVYGVRRKLCAQFGGRLVLGLSALENQRVARFRSAKRSGVASARW